MPQNKIPIALKLSLTPDQETAAIIDGQSKICNWLYNTLVERARVLRKDFVATGNPDSAKSLYTKRGVRNSFCSKHKKDYPEISSRTVLDNIKTMKKWFIPYAEDQSHFERRIYETAKGIVFRKDRK